MTLAPARWGETSPRSRRIFRWREVVGWEEIRGQGGANKIAHRKETGRVICSDCMYAMDSGADPVNQGTLLL